MRQLISRKVFERTVIADARIAPDSPVPFGAFKAPYLFDFLGLKDDYLENDMEAVILRELEHVIREFGKGFAFVERQKRMITDGEDFLPGLAFLPSYP